MIGCRCCPGDMHAGPPHRPAPARYRSRRVAPVTTTPPLQLRRAKDATNRPDEPVSSRPQAVDQIPAGFASLGTDPSCCCAGQLARRRPPAPPELATTGGTAGDPSADLPLRPAGGSRMCRKRLSFRPHATGDTPYSDRRRGRTLHAVAIGWTRRFMAAIAAPVILRQVIDQPCWVTR